MPIYKDYECLDCEGDDQLFEFSKDQGDGPFPESPACPKCGKSNTKSSFRKIGSGKSKVGISIPVYMRSGK